MSQPLTGYIDMAPREMLGNVNLETRTGELQATPPQVAKWGNTNVHQK